MTNFLPWQMDYVVSLQGLFLFVLAARALTLEEAPPCSLPWLWLSLAALAQGLEQWLSLLPAVAGPSRGSAFGLMVLSAAAVSFLAHFGQEGVRRTGGRGPRMTTAPLFGLVLLAGFVAGPPVGRMTGGLIALAAGTWAAVALFRAARPANGWSRFFLGLEGAAILACSLAAEAVLLIAPLLAPRPGVPALAAGTPGAETWPAIPVLIAALALYGYGLTRRPQDLPPLRTGRNRFAIATWVSLALILSLGLAATYYAGLGAQRSLEIQSKAKVTALASLIDSTLKETNHAALSLAQSPIMRQALEGPPSQAGTMVNFTLEEYQKTFRTSVCYLMNTQGLTLASSNYAAPDSFVGHNYGFRPYFQEAVVGQVGSYFARGVTSGERGYYASAAVRDSRGRIIGVAAVKNDLSGLQAKWVSYPHSFLIDPNGVIFLSGRPGLEFHTLWPLAAPVRQYLLSSRQFGDGPLVPAFELPYQAGNNTMTGTGRDAYLVNREDIGRNGWSVVVLSPGALVTDERLWAILLTMLVALGTAVLLLAAEKTFHRTREAAVEAANYQTIFNTVSDGILILDAVTGAILEVNRTVREMFGWRPEEPVPPYIHDLGADGPKQTPEDTRDILRRALGGQPLLFEWLAADRNGRRFWIEVNLKPAVLGGEIRLLAVVRDITHRKKVLEALQTSEATYRTIFEESGFALIIVEADATISLISPAFAAEIGYSREEIEGKRKWTEFIYEEDLPRVKQYSRLRRTFPAGLPANFEFRNVDHQGRLRTLLMTATFIPGTSRSVVALVDITARKAMEESFRHLSLHDALTRLYNRAYFEKQIRLLPRKRPRSAGIIIADVDGLKLVNDTLGHNAGDGQLVAAANVIRKCFGPDTTIARIGGDEFAVLLPEAGSADAQDAALRIREAVAAHNRTEPAIPLSLSLGWAAGKPGTGTNDIFREADNHMYREKLFSSQSGRSAIILALARTLEARDVVTADHVSRLQDLAVALGRELELPENRVSALRLLAQFHDIGKIGIPDRILSKPGPLTSEETLEMQRHTQIGHRIAQSTPDLAPVADFIVKHHEWWNGQGYPFGLAGGEIPLESRIIAIVDAYDAMTSDRPYRKAMAPAEAVAELERCAGTQFDPELVRVFVTVLAKRTTLVS